MTHRFSKGDQIYMPTYDELKTLGWQDCLISSNGIWHTDMNDPNFIIVDNMYRDFGGKWVTISFCSFLPGVYFIECDYNRWHWPLDIINAQWSVHILSAKLNGISDNPACQHEEGMTPIDGWIICRICGNNLRQ